MQTTPLDRLERLVGERTVPDLWHENYWFRRHEIAYLALAPLVTATAGPDGVVVEAGCGEGYGVPLLAGAGAGRIAALDYDAATLAHLTTRYPGTPGVRCNLARLPLAAGGAAAITCFQVFEHLWTPWEFLAECARVLVPGGLLVLTTPNRPTFSPGLGRQERPPNPYHVREYDAEELRATVAAHLGQVRLMGVQHGARLRAWQQEHGDPVAAQLASPPQAWPAHVADLVRSVTADDFVLAPLPDADSSSDTDAGTSSAAARRPPVVDHLDVLDLVVTARATA